MTDKGMTKATQLVDELDALLNGPYAGGRASWLCEHAHEILDALRTAQPAPQAEALEAAIAWAAPQAQVDGEPLRLQLRACRAVASRMIDQGDPMMGGIHWRALLGGIEVALAQPAAPVGRVPREVDVALLHSTTDAVVWAAEFMKVNPTADRDLMVTWFANALCRGRDAERQRAAPQTTVPRDVLDAAVNRFLAWPLPKTFGPDCGISFDKRAVSQPPASWPVGTNLFTADEARQMFEHCLAAPQATDGERT